MHEDALPAPGATPSVPAAEPAPRRSTRAVLVTVRDEAFAWCRTLVSAGVYATLIVTFGFQVARVEGRSMQPTLENEDRLIVNKFAYVIGDPQPGDIVMMFYPADPDKSFVKRIIAESGDTVKIEDGVVYVNGVALADDFVLPDYRSHDDHDSVLVREGFYYVLGDHRSNSADSREFGEVPKKYIVGKVQLRWWPLPSARVF
jgi:signal peptidase I